MDLTLIPAGKLEYGDQLVPGYSGPRIAGAVCQTWRNAAAIFSLQEYVGEGFSLQLGTGRFFSRVMMKADMFRDGLHCLFMINGEVRKKIESKGRLHLRKSQYTWFGASNSSCEARFKENQDFQMLAIHISPAMLNPLISLHPLFKNLMGADQSPSLKARWIFPAAAQILRDLLYFRHVEADQQFYFDLKVKELLFEILQKDLYRGKVRFRFTVVEKAKILQARNILESHISGKAPSIKVLAKMVGMNEYKLKAGFQQFFGSGIYEWIVDQKMDFAKELLLTSEKSVKEVGAAVGYPRTTNFITAFRKRFGFTPLSYRRK